MKRRTMLLTVGSIFAAGCSQGNPRHGNGQGVYQEGKGVGTINQPDYDFGNISGGEEFDIDEIENEFDFNSSQIGSDVTFEFGEDAKSDNKEQLPTPAKSNEQAAKHLQKGRQNILEAISTYASFGGSDYDITAVSPTTDSFSLPRIQSKIRRTRSPLLKASRSATEGQKVLILALEQVGIFLKHTARADDTLQEALSEYHTAIDYLENGDTTNVDPALDRLNKRLKEAQEYIDVINSETDSTSMQIIESDAQEMYEVKLSQLETIVDSLTSLRNAAEDITDGLAELKRGVDEYISRKYDNAEFQLTSAASSLQIGLSSIKNIQSEKVLQNVTRSTLSFASIIYQISYDLQQSAQAKLNHNEDAYSKYRERAIEHLRSDERTQYMQEINQIQW
jgi:exonuclease VII small subunit